VPPVRVLLAVSAVLGFLGTTYLVLAGTSLAFKTTAPDLWFYPNAGRLSPEHVGVPEAAVLTFLALGALVAAWALAGLAVSRGASFRAALLTGLCWTVPLLVGPPLFSADVYHYAAIGASVVHGVDPFVHGPGVLGDSPAIRGAEEFWRNSPSQSAQRGSVPVHRASGRTRETSPAHAATATTRRPTTTGTRSPENSRDTRPVSWWTGADSSSWWAT